MFLQMDCESWEGKTRAVVVTTMSPALPSTGSDTEQRLRECLWNWTPGVDDTERGVSREVQISGDLPSG